MQKLPIRISVLSLLISLLFAACIPAGDYYSASDPELAAIQAQSRADSIAQQATVIADRTAVAEAEAMRATEVEQARRDNASATEIALIEARAQERKDEVALQATEMAIWSVQATATAAPMATQAAYQATLPVAQVTQQALERQVRIDGFNEQRVKVMIWIVPIAVVLFLTFLAWKIGAYIDERIAVMRRKNAAAETLAGPIVWVWDADIDDYRWELLQDVSLTRRLKARSDFNVVDAVEVSRGGVTATSTPDNGDDRSLAIELVKDAIKKAEKGENDRVIPRWSELDWTSTNWSKAVRWLKVRRAVSPIERVGTFVNYDSLAKLLYLLETDQLPTPR